MDVPYPRAKDYIEKEIVKYRLQSKETLPTTDINKIGSKISIKFQVHDEANLFSLLNYYIKTMGDMKISADKALPESLYVLEDNKALFLFSKPKKIVDIVKLGELNDEEISMIIDLYRQGNPITKDLTPLEQLAELGVVLFDPTNGYGWDYLAGYENVKDEIKETILLPLQYPEIYADIALRTRKTVETNRPKAVLFEGPSGTGKTTAARILAKEVNVPLVYVPLETIVTKWYGESEKNLSKIFVICKQAGDCLIFFDEIDALATSRDNDMHEASRRVLSVLLREIDGFVPNDKTILIAATNRKNDLDAALLNRFDLDIFFPLPTENERMAIFSNYAKHLQQNELEMLAKKSNGLSGRNIRDVCKYAERRWAAKLIRKQVTDPIPLIDEYVAALKNKCDTFDVKKYII